MGFQPDHAVWHREPQADHIAEPGVCGPMQGCTAGVVLHVDVGVREFSKNLGVQQASGPARLMTALMNAVRPVASVAVRFTSRQSGVLWEPAGIEAHGL